jgi:hypothetical protein
LFKTFLKLIFKRKFDGKAMITLPDVGLVINKLMGSGYLSQYSKREFKIKYTNICNKIVRRQKRLELLQNLELNIFKVEFA